MSWFSMFKKRAGDGRRGHAKTLVLRGYIERFSAVVPLYVGGSAENSYALLLKDDNRVVLFRRAIIDHFCQAQIALLQPGDYVEFEVDSRGFGKIETLTSTVWSDWERCSGQSKAESKEKEQEEEPSSSRPNLTLHKNPQWKEHKGE